MREPAPDAIRCGYLDLAEGQVHYRMRAGTGVPVVFLHQTASSSRMWTAVMQRLAVANPLWAFDTPGFGNSFDPAQAPKMADYVGWLRAMIEAIGGGPVHLVGHHTGAYVALAAADGDPALAASLTLIGPAALSAQVRAEYAAKLGAPFRPGRSGAYLLQNWEYLRVGGAGAQTALLHREMIDMLRGWAARPHAYGAVWEQDVEAQLRRVTCPLHLISAPDDLLFDRFAETCAIRPDARVSILSGGANFVPDLRADELADQLMLAGLFA